MMENTARTSSGSGRKTTMKDNLISGASDATRPEIAVRDDTFLVCTRVPPPAKLYNFI